MVQLNVQWTKEKYEIDFEPSLGLAGLQAVLLSLTNVPVERQKIMMKGKFVKDDAGLAALKDGDKIMLMGSADALPAAPTKKIVFEEDMTDAQKISVVKDLLSAGLHNLGNTCYMASTLQCLRAVPELKQALVAKSRAAPPAQHDPNHGVVKELGTLYAQMDRTIEPVTPMMFTTVFRSTFPQFAETNNEGHWMQQDAEEALIQLMNAMANVLKTSGVGSIGNAAANNTIDEYFGGQLEIRTVPTGTDPWDPSAKVEREGYRRLRCFIDNETHFLFEGIRLSLKEELELRGSILQRTSTLLTLPRYLIVQMMRFDWRRDTQKKSKKLRRVDFPFKLDVSEFAHPTLKHQLTSARNLLKEEQDAQLGLKSLSKKVAPTASPSPPPAAAAVSSTTTAAAPDAANPWAAGTDSAASMEVDSGNAAPATAAALTLTTPTSGQFELFGVVTHKGRTSDSGHYISFTKTEGEKGQWMKFDDDVVTRVDEAEVKALAGGGDAHMAYLLFYRRIDDATKFIGHAIPPPTVEKPAEKKADSSSSSSSSTPAAAAASK